MKPPSFFTGAALVIPAFCLLLCCAPEKKPEFALGQASGQAPASGAEWRVLGPGGGGGQFLPTINPQDSNHVFVRCDMTGAYVTLDGGQSWRMFNLRTVVRDFEFDP
ncbi:MAG: hypothetical protein JXQ83_13090, partial [Candidatus Glassbacteria bacterium]|nr:hypothetical protein [Candidatus Glassbacteria bacterium]